LRIEDGRIASLDSEPAHPLKSDAQTIDGTGKTVIPGLIDAHCHISYGEGRSSEEVDIYGGAAFSAIRAAWNDGKVLASGVTTMCDPGSTWDIAVAVRDAIESGMIVGPRVVAASRHITAIGGFGDPYPTWIGTPESSEGIACASIAEMIAEVRRQVKNRVDVVKISGDVVAKDARAAQSSCMTTDEMRAMVDEAHRLGRKVAIHARYEPTVRSAIDAGVDWIYHASYASADTVRRAADREIAICPTLTYSANIVHYAKELGVHQGYVDVKRRELDALATLISRCRESGVRLMAGSESGFAVTPYGEWHARELELFVTLGSMPCAEVIAMATRGNARELGMGDTVGTLAPGMLADFLIVDGDPLADIRVLQDRERIEAVFKEGRAVQLMRELPLRRQLPHERHLTIATATLTGGPRARAGTGRG
jgi:imidazolonepropionase-like amidohydrolase